MRFALIVIALIGLPVASALGDQSIDYSTTVTFFTPLDVTGTLTIGDTGTGSLTIRGGYVSDGTAILGASAGSNGTATFNAGGSHWTNSASLIVGQSGTGTLLIERGKVTDTNATIAENAGSIGAVTVTGPISSWTNSGILYVGQSGTGKLTVSNGGTVSDVTGYVNGTATVDGTGSSWTNSNALTVGTQSNGALTISNGGSVSGLDAIIGRSAGVTGTVAVDSGASWTVTGDLTIGHFGIGTLTISNGATVSTNGVIIANQSGSTGTLIIGAASGSTAVAPGTFSASTVTFGSGTGTIVFNHTSTNYTFGANISGAGSVEVEGGTTTLSGTNSYSGNTVISAGTLRGGAANTFSAASATTINSGGTLDLGGFAQTINALTLAGGTLQNGALTGAITSNGGTISGISGPASLTMLSGTTTLGGTNSFTGGTTLSSGTLSIGSNNALGSGNLTMAAGTTLSFLSSGNFSLANNIKISGDPTFSVASGTVQTISGVIADGGSAGTLEKEGDGTLVLSATNTYTGATNINAGTLEVDGSIASSSLTTVNSGATLAGVGTIGSTLINSGGTLMPGTSAFGTLTIDGNLTMRSGSSYGVQISPTQSSRTQVNGTATLNGATVVVTPQLGTYSARTYTILTATNALGSANTFDPTVKVTRSGVISHPTLTYDANNAYLSVQAYIGLIILPGSSGASQDPSNAQNGSGTPADGIGRIVPFNAQNAAAAINNFILADGILPSGYQNLNPLFGESLVNAVGQLAGQAGPSFVPIGFAAGSTFLNLMLNPYIEGRVQDSAAGPGLMAYAPESSIARATASIFGAFDKAGLKTSLEPRYTFWTAAYGGSGTITGNAMTGAATTTAGIYGVAAGLDYRVTPDTTIGFALGGGGTNWMLSQGFGAGHSGMAQAGLYAKSQFGQAYLADALAYSWQDVAASRVVTLAGFDTLNSNFGANIVSNRLEAGYRLPLAHLPFGLLPENRFGVTPYAAAQAQGMFVPAFAEYASPGASSQFALNYASRGYSVVRTEFGAWLDYDVAFGGEMLKLYSRTAFAHDFENESTAIASFLQLPGSVFLINTAKPAANGALVTAGLEYRLADGWSVLGKFDGEFSSTTDIYSGTGVIRKVW